MIIIIIIIIINSVALKAFMVLPTLILQKPSATSKSKEHSEAIERRLTLWKQGDIDLLLKEVRFFQGKFVNSKKPRKVEDISKAFFLKAGSARKIDSCNETPR